MYSPHVSAMPAAEREILRKFKKWKTKNTDCFVFRGILLAEKFLMPDLTYKIIKYFGDYEIEPTLNQFFDDRDVGDYKMILKDIKDNDYKNFFAWKYMSAHNIDKSFNDFIEILVNTLIQNKYEFFCIHKNMKFFYSNNFEEALEYSFKNNIPLYKSYNIDNVKQFSNDYCSKYLYDFRRICR